MPQPGEENKMHYQLQIVKQAGPSRTTLKTCPGIPDYLTIQHETLL